MSPGRFQNPEKPVSRAQTHRCRSADTWEMFQFSELVYFSLMLPASLNEIRNLLKMQEISAARDFMAWKMDIRSPISGRRVSRIHPSGS